MQSYVQTAFGRCGKKDQKIPINIPKIPNIYGPEICLSEFRKLKGPPVVRLPSHALDSDIHASLPSSLSAFFFIDVFLIDVPQGRR